MASKKNDNISSWITVKGEHIPVKEGQSKAQAVKSKIKGGKGVKKGVKTNKAKYDKLLTKKKGKK